MLLIDYGLGSKIYLLPAPGLEELSIHVHIGAPPRNRHIIDLLIDYGPGSIIGLFPAPGLEELSIHVHIGAPPRNRHIIDLSIDHGPESTFYRCTGVH